jgi:FHS family glucose/mannose:H+ symporter-like MFS transporter
MNNSPGKPHSAANAVLCAAFILTGIVNTMLGPLLPTLSRHWGLSDVQGGEFFTAQFLASIVGVLASSLLTPRRGPAFSLGAGFLLMAVGTWTLFAGSWRMGLAAAACFGCGLGLDIPTVNLLVSNLNITRRASALSLINMAWGVGAVLCPLLLLWGRHAGKETLVLQLLAVALLLLAVILWRTFNNIGGERGAKSVADGSERWHWSDWSVILLGATFFLYVGCETAVGGWSASHAKRIGGDGGAWLMVPSLFWFLLMAGRGVAPILLRRVPEMQLARAGLLLATVGTGAFLWLHNTAALALAAAVAGLGFSCVFPIAISVLSSQFEPFAAELAGPMFALAGLGGAVLPWLVGFVSTRASSLRVGLLVPLAACFAMIACNILLSRLQGWKRKAAG